MRSTCAVFRGLVSYPPDWGSPGAGRPVLNEGDHEKGAHPRSAPSAPGRARACSACVRTLSCSFPGERAGLCTLGRAGHAEIMRDRQRAGCRKEAAPEGSRFLGPGASSLRGDAGCHEGWQLAYCVGDLDLVGLGLLGYGDGYREHAVLVRGGDVLAVQAFPEE